MFVILLLYISDFNIIDIFFCNNDSSQFSTLFSILPPEVTPSTEHEVVPPPQVLNNIVNNPTNSEWYIGAFILSIFIIRVFGITTGVVENPLFYFDENGNFVWKFKW